MAASVSVSLCSRIWESATKLSKILTTTKRDKKKFLMKQLLSSTNSRFRMQTFKSSLTSCCVCVKRITLYSWLCSSSCSCSSSLSCVSVSANWNIEEFGAKSYFTDHETANTIYRFRNSVPVLKIYDCY